MARYYSRHFKNALAVCDCVFFGERENAEEGGGEQRGLSYNRKILLLEGNT